MQILEYDEWAPQAAAHAARVDQWVQPHLERRRRGEKHPVLDFIFSYYNYRPAALRRWHPGYGFALASAEEYAQLKGYESVGPAVGVSTSYVESQRPLINSIHRLLVATRDRPATFGCFGLHEWAMVYRQDETRHQLPLRLGGRGTDAVVESHRIACSHFDAFRFFTDEARPLNTLQPGRDDRPDFEQPGCLHASMDLYKHAYRLSPMIGSDLIADCLELAIAVREVDMRASPYDLSELDYTAIPIETSAGKATYAAQQRGFAEQAAPLREHLIALCERWAA
ncbi:MAG TPA: 3-methyladenine DNA glycosylase [Marmoricola sp.]|nr:3-methyladenine DNA glycosylase [Marmoricola sp.]HNJ78618.1 3-methyladenine DNA glycosylase [Marmoricola sp.]HNN48744.1 3-methyladenine DNA glycosylase [Marmoricola sp.]HNO40251.1 3-methyladenine DNA glycosylase [Marmoricola sp.]